MIGWLLSTGGRLFVDAYNPTTDRACWEQRLVGTLLIRAGLCLMHCRIWLGLRP